MQPFFSNTRASMMFSPTMKWRFKRGFRFSSATDFQERCWSCGFFVFDVLTVLLDLDFCIGENTFFTTSLLGNGTPLPRGGNSLHALDSLSQCRHRGGKRESDKLLTGRSKCCSGNRSNTGILQQESAEFLGAQIGRASCRE